MQRYISIPVSLQYYTGDFQGSRAAASLFSLQVLGTTLPVFKQLEESCCKFALTCYVCILLNIFQWNIH